MTIFILLAISVVLIIVGIAGWVNDKFPAWFVRVLIVCGVVIFFASGIRGIVLFDENHKAEVKEAYEYTVKNNIPVYLDGQLVDIKTVSLDFYKWEFNEDKTTLFLTRKSDSSGGAIVTPVPVVIH